MAGSCFRTLPKIPHCCLSKKPGPCLSSSVADPPLRAAKDYRLGRQLPFQLPNLPRAHQKAIKCLFIFYQEVFLGDSHVLLTRSLYFLEKIFNLHVLGLFPAFILSQDQAQFQI